VLFSWKLIFDVVSGTLLMQTSIFMRRTSARLQRGLQGEKLFRTPEPTRSFCEISRHEYTDKHPA
jgi:hypothetical protein